MRNRAHWAVPAAHDALRIISRAYGQDNPITATETGLAAVTLWRVGRPGTSASPE